MHTSVAVWCVCI